MALKDYVEEWAKGGEPKVDSTPSGVACPELECEGEMMWDEPRKKHPEHKERARARCEECPYKGWV